MYRYFGNFLLKLSNKEALEPKIGLQSGHAKTLLISIQIATMVGLTKSEKYILLQQPKKKTLESRCLRLFILLNHPNNRAGHSSFDIKCGHTMW